MLETKRSLGPIFPTRFWQLPSVSRYHCMALFTFIHDCDFIACTHCLAGYWMITLYLYLHSAGFVDDVIGWDFIDNDNDPMDERDTYHGTHVAGTKAAL